MNPSSSRAQPPPLSWLFALVLGVACGPSPSVDSTPSPEQLLADLAGEVRLAALEDYPLLRLRDGLPVEALPDLSFEAARRRADEAAVRLETLEALDASTLTPADRLTWETMRWQDRRTVEGIEHFWHFFPVPPYTWSFSGVDAVFGGSSVGSEEARARYLDLLEQLPALAATLEARLAGQAARGVRIPSPELDGVVGLIRAHAAVGESSPFAVASGRLQEVEEEAAERFLAQVDERIVAAAEAFGRLADSLESGGVDAPEEVGLDTYPGGDAAYRWAVRLHTGLDLDPEAIHEMGLDRVARILDEMGALQIELGYGDESREEFHARLRSDPRFLASSPDEVGSRLRQAVERIEPRIGELFERLPAAPYGVARLDPALEASMTFGYYQWPTPDRPQGTYFFNGSRLDQRPLVGAAALIYHELLPGHHLQIARQLEDETLPAFRRDFLATAFVEGWAEYAADLAGEVGMYDDPWDRYGRLSMDLFLSARLVADTALNQGDWSLEETREYLGTRLLESETQIATETLRYAVDIPGQALAYQLGSWKIRELRRRAQEELGDRFDLRRFHEAVLSPGALPLAVLEGHIDRWIEGEKS